MRYLVTPFDVRRGQRTQRSRHFRKAQVGEVALLERRDPVIESHGRV
jgi:hypothetical protein